MRGSSVISVSCICAKSVGGGCGHVAGLLHQVTKFKTMKPRAVPEHVAETYQKRTWHQPRGEKIAGDEVQLLTVVGYGKYKSVYERTDPRPRVYQHYTIFNFS